MAPGMHIAQVNIALPREHGPAPHAFTFKRHHPAAAAAGEPLVDPRVPCPA